MVNTGTLLALIILGAQFNLTIGVPIALTFTAVFLRNFKQSGQQNSIVFLLIILIVWMFMIQLTIGNRSIISTTINALGAVSIILFSRKSITQPLLHAFFRAAYLIFLLDLAFNLSIVLTGTDPLGRGGSLRDGDLIARVGGLLGHPFASVNFTVVGAIAAIVLRSKTLLLIAAFGLLINGTLRAPLSLAVLLTVLLFLRYYPRAWIFLIGQPILTATVLVFTYLTTNQSDFISGNDLRVIAWRNAIARIMESPFFGVYDFRTGPIIEMSADTIIEFGIAESALLQMWLDYGLFAPLLYYIVLYLIMSTSIRKLRTDQSNHFYFAGATISTFVFMDMSYGTFFGSLYTTIPLALLCLAYILHPQSEREEVRRAAVS